MLRAQMMLTALWWGWGMLLFALLAFLTMRSVLGDGTEAWGWFLPNILPAMTLVGAASYLGSARGGPRVRAAVRTPLLLLAMLASAAYLLMLTVVILSPLSSDDPIQMMLRSNLFLTPFQALALSAVGTFFAKADPG